MADPMVALTRITVFGFLVALAFVIAAKILNGEINTRYLFCQRQADGNHENSPGRVQLLIFTVLIASKYLFDAARSAGSGHLPDVPNETLILLSGSHAVYLGGKAYSTFLSHPNQNKENKK
jgi:hypothetical protein